MTLEAKLRRYVERRFKESGNTEWPTVREAARALRVRQAEVEQAAQEHPFMLTSYFVSPPDPIANHFIEICE